VLCVIGIILAVGLSRETTKEKNDARAEADKYKKELQDAIEKNNVLAAQAVAQLTGGNGFPFAVVKVPPSTNDGRLTLMIGVNGDASLNDVSFSVLKGPLPTFDQIRQSRSLLEWRSHPKMVGSLHPNMIQILPDTLEVSKKELTTYQIAFAANNGMVLETLDIRYNDTIDTWQYRYKIVSERNTDNGKLLIDKQWLPMFGLNQLPGR
jgi:hypothetical protein